jgi:hypothetical protein
MESLDETKSTSIGFFKHVFNFNQDSKAEILNIVQYSLIALIPIVILNKSMQKFIPEADEQKGSLEILAEIVGQILVIFIGLLFINRIITFIPNWSGVKYPEINVINIILCLLLITLSLQTKLGEKVSILFERVVDLWEGRGSEKKQGQKKTQNGGSGSGNMKITQPISGGQYQKQPQMQEQISNQYNQMAMNQSLSNTTSIDSLPTYSQQSQQKQELPDYDGMYKNQTTPLVNPEFPPQMGGGGIMAANELLGGSFGSTF